MLTLDHPAMSLPVEVRPALWARMSGRVIALTRFYRNRSAFSIMSEMTDAQLKDIGLRRYDFKEAGSLGFGDPITRLNRIVDARSNGEHAARQVC